MNQATGFQAPQSNSYDVVIVGGAIYGSSVAWFLANNPDFNGSILVVERDPSYSACSRHTPTAVCDSNSHARLTFASHSSQRILLRISVSALAMIPVFPSCRLNGQLAS